MIKKCLSQLHLSIGIHRYAPVTRLAKNGELAKELNRHKTKMVAVSSVVAIAPDTNQYNTGQTFCTYAINILQSRFTSHMSNIVHL